MQIGYRNGSRIGFVAFVAGTAASLATVALAQGYACPPGYGYSPGYGCVPVAPVYAPPPPVYAQPEPVLPVFDALTLAFGGRHRDDHHHYRHDKGHRGGDWHDHR